MCRFALFLATIVSLSAQGTNPVAETKTGEPLSRAGGRIQSDTLIARSLQGNLLGDAVERRFFLYLPPTYDTAPLSSYPVIYLLPAFGGGIDSWINGRIQGMNIKDDMDRLIAAGEAREMIIVMADSRNHYFGSHYVNSVVNGGWADAVVRDLVGHVDRKYRTIAKADSRGLAGYSMGGGGALYLAMKYPGVFGSVYGLSSGWMAFEHSPPVTNEVWKRVLELQRAHPIGYEFKVPEEIDEARAIGFATAYSPNAARRPFMADLPVQLVDGELKLVPAVWRRWLAYDPVVLLKRYAGSLRRLQALQFDCGKSDQLWEPNRIFARQLQAARVPYSFEEYDGTHTDHIRERIVKRMLPFFSNHLERK
jgi:enterochelin esterase-like enzyme